MKASDEPGPAQAAPAGLILLLAEKPAMRRGFNEPSRNTTETSTAKPISWLRAQTLFPPSRRPMWLQWQWEFVTRYSGATVPDFHEVPW